MPLQLVLLDTVVALFKTLLCLNWFNCICFLSLFNPIHPLTRDIQLKFANFAMEFRSDQEKLVGVYNKELGRANELGDVTTINMTWMKVTLLVCRGIRELTSSWVYIGWVNQGWESVHVQCDSFDCRSRLISLS